MNDTSPASLDEVASKLTARVEKLGCDSDECSLLVTNLATNSGSTSRLGIQASAKLAQLLSKSVKGRVIACSLLQQFLNRERIPSKIVAETAVTAWLGKKLGATIVLSGDIDVAPPVPQALFTLINVRSPKEPDLFGIELPLPPFADADLKPEEGFGPLPTPVVTQKGEALYLAGVSGVSLPSCKHMENPSYTGEAPAEKINGLILLDAVVNTDGTVREARIRRGLPYGLNQNALVAVESWHCSPAPRDGKPVPVLVPFEINFRIK